MFFCNGKGATCDRPCIDKDCEFYDGTGGKQLPTVIQKIRSMSESEVADRLIKLDQILAETDRSLSRLWCDGRGACLTAGEDVDCDEDMHKACVLRYLRSAGEVPV